MSAAAGLDPDTARRMLRAYEHPPSCLVASIVLDRTGGGGLPDPACGCVEGPETSRDVIRAVWAARVPQDAGKAGNKSIHTRLRRVLGVLEMAGLIRRRRQRVIVVDPVRLGIAAGNLRLMFDGDGRWLPPDQWPGRPDVPDELLEAQLDRINGVRRG